MNELPPVRRERGEERNRYCLESGRVVLSGGGLSGDPVNASHPCDWFRADESEPLTRMRDGQRPHGMACSRFPHSSLAGTHGHFIPTGSFVDLRGAILNRTAGHRPGLVSGVTLVAGADFSRKLVISPGFDVAVRRFHRVELRRQECHAG